ncbi:MAG: T9SS type A sorting domain-containing protein [Algoriella sp.]|uniref:T9SS type A sorting domain-containing protein n=3 Tax=Algoriella sp. TaxID=1872434 RepID=UPI002FC8BB27
MKKIYTLLFIASTTIIQAQQAYSFETSEGFVLGNLNQQNNWEVSKDGDGKIINNQIVTNELASDGTNSFKNGNQADYKEQWFPIMGATKVFDTPTDYKNFTITFDANVTKRNGADFEFTLYTVNTETDEFYPVAGFGMENRGYLYITKDINYGFDYADDAKDWPINKWNNFKIEVSENEIKYYLNSKLVYTGNNFTKANINGFTMLHNNYGGDAYYDNFKITTENLAINTVNQKELKIYPNPIKDYLAVDTSFQNQIASIEIINTLGQVILKENNVTNRIDTDKLQAGVYVAKIILKDGKVINRKIIKK